MGPSDEANLDTTRADMSETQSSSQRSARKRQFRHGFWQTRWQSGGVEQTGQVGV